MRHCIYYTRPNGRKPAKEWIEVQDSRIQASIDDMKGKLKSEDIDVLVANRMLVPIRENPGGRVVPGFYELKKYGWRVAVYYDKKRDSFVMMCGWLKKKDLQKSDVDKAITLLQEYLDG